MTTLPLELVICYSVLMSLTIVLKMMKRSDRFKEIYSRVKNLKNSIETSVKTNSTIDLHSILNDVNDVNNHLQLLDDIFFELPD